MGKNFRFFFDDAEVAVDVCFNYSDILIKLFSRLCKKRNQLVQYEKVEKKINFSVNEGSVRHAGSYFLSENDNLFFCLSLAPDGLQNFVSLTSKIMTQVFNGASYARSFIVRIFSILKHMHEGDTKTNFTSRFQHFRKHILTSLQVIT